MGVAKQLYQLQERDLEIDAAEQALKQRASQLGESEALTGARARLKRAATNISCTRRSMNSPRRW